MAIDFSIKAIELVNTIILGLTGLVVFWYTKAAEQSNEIQERPILNLYLRKTSNGSNNGYIPKIRNVGKGPAYNIKFYGIEADGYTYYPYFNEANPILESGGDEKEIKLWVTTPDNGVEMYDASLGFNLLISRLFGKVMIQRGEYDSVARSAGVFLISYEGVSSKSYYSIFRIYSKIEPLFPGVDDLVVEFIENKQGKRSLEESKRVCNERSIMKKNES